MSLEDDDSSGKRKGRGRSAALSAVFLMGLCLGIVISEYLYVGAQESGPSSTTLETLRSYKASSGDQTSTTTTATATATTTAVGGGGTTAAFRKGSPRNELETLLRDVAPEGEVMIAISNFNLVVEGALGIWLDCVGKLPSTNNWLVVAIDEELRDYCKDKGIKHYYRPVVIPKSQANTGDNHAISAMKYEIVEEFLSLGWNVLLSDVDIVTIQNPFQYLYRDSDVEGMTDGYDDETAYGGIWSIDDPSMGWSRYAQGIRHMVLNSGLFYVQANERTIHLMQRIALRLHAENAWDQTVWNEEIFFLSHGDEYKSPQVSVRVMDYSKFMNSKVLFKKVRHMPTAKQPKPVMVHMNYHPDKTERMRAAVKYYLQGDKNALKSFPGGSEPGT